LIKKRIYFENLDGWRFISFLLIFLYHSFYTEFDGIKLSSTYHFIKKDLFGNGNLGVNFFFVLSGFLITYLLIEEKKMNGQINLLNFWRRRILRIWPLFYFCVFFGFVIFPLIKSIFGQTSSETANPIYYMFFLNNFDIISRGLPDASILGVLWSVAIEEQFYFFWPIIVLVFPLKKLWIPFVALLIVNISFRAYYDNDLYNELHTISCIGDMTIGALGAWLICTSNSFKEQVVNLSKTKIFAIYLLFIFAFFFRDELLQINYFSRVFERLVIAILIILILLEQNFSRNSLFKMSSFKLLSNLGSYTYGMYCLHFIGILVSLTLIKMLHLNNHFWHIFFTETILAFFITIYISKLSYKYFETPFLKLKDKFSFITKD
jgi:peptidoglycan/LPS O-acetylase OafA/YrhL